MKILSAKQIREADAYTIAHQPIASIDLMERTANSCADRIASRISGNTIKFFCGLGNNGGDGLAIARMLKQDEVCDVQVYIIRYSEKCSPDFLINEERLRTIDATVLHEIKSEKDFPTLTADDCVVDAIFGTGLSKPAEGVVAQLITHINASKAKVLSVDMPSGLFADEHTPATAAVIHADVTLTFQCAKLAFLFPENEERVGEWHVLNIGLDEKFIAELPATKSFITKEMVKAVLKTRKKFSHKGTYGHALLIAGSYGKMGAAVLATRACLRSGAGLTTVHVPKCGNEIIQTSVPEAMATIDADEKYFTENIATENYSATGIGCGIGTENQTQAALKNLLSEIKSPLILDADALNILSLNKEWLKIVPKNSILTPHPKEFERLAGKASNDFSRHQMQIDFSVAHQVYVILKGAHTCITTPSGESFFNTTGNPGMAKGGSGDVLTGILTSLLAQQYSPLETSLLGVYLHGLAGDLAAKQKGMDGMIAGDLIEFIPEAFVELRK